MQPAGPISEGVTATTASSCARSRACSLTGRRASSWTLRKTTLAKIEGGMNCARFYSAGDALKAERRVDHHQRDAPGDLLVLDDQDLAALALGPPAGIVVAAAGHGAGRALAELAALLQRRGVADALDRGGEIRDDLVDAGDEDQLAGAEGVAGKAVAAAVDVDDLAAQG